MLFEYARLDIFVIAIISEFKFSFFEIKGYKNNKKINKKMKLKLVKMKKIVTFFMMDSL